MNTKEKAPASARYRAWCGVYAGRKKALGWLMNRFGYNKYPSSLEPGQEESLSGKSRKYASVDFYRVEVSVKPLRDKNGKLIVRRHKGRR